MSERVVLKVEELKELCPKCFEKMEKSTTVKVAKVTKVSISKADYFWLTMNKEDRPPKEWFDTCVDAVSEKADDPNALCGWIWYHQMGNDEEAYIPDSEDVEGIQDEMRMEGAYKEAVSKLKKDIAIVVEWRKSGKVLTKEEQFFAEKVADEMIGFKVLNKSGAQLISRERIDFIKSRLKKERSDVPVGSDAVAGITQDAVAIGQAKKEKDKRVAEVVKADIKAPKAKELETSEAATGVVPKKTPDIENIKTNPPENQKEGEVSSVADTLDEVQPKDETGKPTEDVDSEKLGHQPNLPMPQKQAEDLINNAKWGVEIGAYTNVKEGVERQLGRKAYEEFVDTPEKLKAVVAYIKTLIPETEAVPVGEGVSGNGEFKRAK